MKETPLSKCERKFILDAIIQNQRLDGRKNDECRNATIRFGTDWGSVFVALGETKVLAQISCELGLPKSTRPNEGMMYINVELGPMAAPHFEAGRNSELCVQINRTLERAFKDSRCIDLESLCITAEERVWILRVDLNALNHAGNLIDCCSIATLAALAHFKRPDVSIVENNVRIHTAAEKEHIPLVLHHYPVCVSYCIFNEGLIAVADPTAKEERIAESLMVFGLNSFRELCCLNLGGTSLTSATMLLQCAHRAANHAKFMVDHIKQSLETDKAAREATEGGKIGFTECLHLNEITGLAEDRLALRLRNFSFQDIFTTHDHSAMKENGDANEVDKTQKKTTTKWIPEDDDESNDDGNVVNMDSDNDAESDDNKESLAQTVETALQHVRQNPTSSKQRRKKQSSLHFSQRNLDASKKSDSEEESTVML